MLCPEENIAVASPVTTLTSPNGVRLSVDTEGHGPPLVLVHGSFSDHRSNWARVRPLLTSHYTIYALARRGRGGTDATQNHRLEDEAQDVVSLIKVIGGRVFLAGHSYGANVALAAVAACPALVRKLILYEPPKAAAMGPESVRKLEDLGQREDWDLFTETFFREILMLPKEELDGMRASEAWHELVSDARASLGDIRALAKSSCSNHQIDALHLPVLLQVGTESPREMFATDLLARTLPDARIETLLGQGHEGMNTAPNDYARSVIDFLSSS